MSFDVDPRFRKAGQSARDRSARRRVRRIGLLGGGGLLVVLAAGALGWAWWTRPPAPEAPIDVAEASAEGELDADIAMVPVASSAEVGLQIELAPFIDLRRDPMILRLGGADGGAARLAGPDTLEVARVGPASQSRLALVREPLVQRTARLTLTVPSSGADLAFFQAQRARGIVELLDQTGPDQTTPTGATAAPDAASGSSAGDAGELVQVAGDEGSWGELIEGEAVADTATYVDTRIENTTSVALALPDAARVTLFADEVIVAQTARTLDEILTTAGLSPETAAAAVTATRRLVSLPDPLLPGSIVALRLRPEEAETQLLQMSVYGPEGYIASLAQTGAARFAEAADPWLGADLIARSDPLRAQAVTQGEVRLLDALYDAAIRNGMSTTLVGELIVMMSQRHDLDRIAAEEDEVTLLYAPDPGTDAQGAAQLLFARIDGPSGSLNCYVTRPSPDEDYGCYDTTLGGNATGRLGGGLLVPVSGTKTSSFGPRMHPILRQLRNHNGVDWAAPTGTPVRAAADGRVSVAGDGGGYGNVVYLDHAGSIQTRYAHLDRFSDLGRAGAEVQAGDVIGYVGTTGRSTGPHLHFEVWVSGTPINPETMVGAAVASSSQPGSGAVEALVNQIIAVESAGRADARNPLSTATGLGQFIESTWLRMMQDYRPDLTAGRSRQEVLDLRLNPELSREMVRNLARENEAFLRARGHQITAGRLYLAHFLGPGGAHTALSAGPGQTVLEVMGSGVVGANPFLRGKTVADLWAWADRKMQGRGGSAAPPPPPSVAIPAEVRAYMTLIDEVLEQAG